METGDKLLIDFKAYFEADNNTWNNDEGGRMVYELLDEQGGYLYTTTGTRQWRAVHINGNAQTWRSYNVNFTIPQTYKADGTPYNGKIKIKTNAWVNILHNPTYFDEFKMQILPHDYVAPTNENYYFSAVIEMSADYHEFGMNMEGRGFSGSLNYRFGYQGSEKDNEVNSSNGTSYTTEFRQLDTRLGRWFSSDPVFQPWQSSYTSMDNNPVNLTDVLGDVTGDSKKGNWFSRIWNKFTGKQDSEIEGVSDGKGGVIGTKENPIKNDEIVITASKTSKKPSWISRATKAVSNFFTNIDNWLEGLASEDPTDILKGDSEAPIAVVIVDDSEDGESSGGNSNAQKASASAQTVEIPQSVLEAFGGFRNSKEYKDFKDKASIKRTGKTKDGEEYEYTLNVRKDWSGGLNGRVVVTEKITARKIQGKVKVRNEHLAGKVHPKTGVLFDKNGFPNFSKNLYKGGKNDVIINPTGTNAGDFAAANQAAGYKSTPKGYTWHHHQDKGRMQLVERDIHMKYPWS